MPYKKFIFVCNRFFFLGTGPFEKLFNKKPWVKRIEVDGVMTRVLVDETPDFRPVNLRTIASSIYVSKTLCILFSYFSHRQAILNYFLGPRTYRVLLRRKPRENGKIPFVRRHQRSWVARLNSQAQQSRFRPRYYIKSGQVFEVGSGNAVGEAGLEVPGLYEA